MEIIHCSCSSNLQFLQPLLNFPFSHSFSTKLNHRLHTPLRTSCLSQSLNIPRHSLRKSITTPRSLADNATFGMNSTMKTSLGKLLADTLRYYYFDSDSLVEEAAGGESASKSFRERDEKGFRDSETEVLKQLSSMGRLVVCAGDGAVQSPTNLAFMRHGISIWIDVPLDMVAKGAIEDGCQPPESEKSTPGSFSEVLSQLTVLYEEMRGGYATADATVSLQKVACKLGYDDLDAVTTEDMIMEVLTEIQKLTRVKKMMEAAARPF